MQKNLIPLVIITITILILLLFLIGLYNYNYNNKKNENEYFKSNIADMTDMTDMAGEKEEKNRTKLYGSLFLDNLDEQIKQLTDPKINYNTKRIDIIKYNDILL